MELFEKWFAGMISAGLSGGATAAVGAFAIPDLLVGPAGWQKLGILFAGGAAVGVLNYLKQSPLIGEKKAEKAG